MRHHALLLFALATSAPALAQTPVVIVDRSTNVSGVGLVRGISKFAINDLGEWVMLVDTNNPDQDRDGAVIRNGLLTLQEGQPLPQPPGAVVDEINSLTLDAAGNIAWDITTKTGIQINDTGLYFNTRKVAHSNEPFSIAGYGPGATWSSFTETIALNNNRQILVSCDVFSDSIGAGTSPDAAFVLLEIDSQGNIISGTDVAHEAGPVPGLTSTVQANAVSQTVFPGAQTQLAINDRGQIMWQVKLQTDPDRALYVDANLIALEGDPSPVPGEVWTTLSNVSLDLNDRGDYTHFGSITGAPSRNEIISKNGELFIQEFDTFPALEGRRVGFSGGGSTPIQITNGGEVLWYINATGSVADKGVLMSREWVVRRDVTVAKGLLVSVFPEGPSLFSSSPGGRFVIVECTLEDGENVALLVDLGRVTPLEDCGGNPAELFRSSGFAVLDETVRLGMDEGQGVGVTPFLLVSTSTVPSWPPCGLQSGFGELVIGFDGGNPVQGIVGAPWSGTQPTVLDLPIPNDPSLIDREFYAQGFFVDVGNQIPGPPEVVATNAVEIEIGAP